MMVLPIPLVLNQVILTPGRREDFNVADVMHCRVAHDKSDISDDACSTIHRYVYMKFVQAVIVHIATNNPSGHHAADW